MLDFQGANGSPPLCVIAFFRLLRHVLEPLQKLVWSRFEHYVFVDLCNQGLRPFFQWLMALILP